MEKPRIIREITVDSANNRADRPRASIVKCSQPGWIASGAPVSRIRFATISRFAAAAHMNDRFVSNARAPLASSEMPADLMANAIRVLAMDAVQQANSGHPGMPMGMADIAVALWGRHLSHNPANPRWINRDRFVLSNGHGSMLQYALLHLTGYDLPLQELKNFRKLHSHTPGHPELGITPGVETTTGPLGQGFANAVGMALAESCSPRSSIVQRSMLLIHRTYVFRR